MADKNLAPADARDLLMLSIACAKDDGSLMGVRERRYAFHDEHQLAAVLRISIRPLGRHWKRWQTAGWVRVAGRPNQGRLERWLVAEGHDRDELEPVVSSGDDKVELKPASSIRKSTMGGVRARLARGPRPLSKTDGNGRFQNSPADPTDCLRLGLAMLALGVPIQIIKPNGTVVECMPDDHGPLLRMLGSNNPTLAIAALIADKPSPRVLSGREQSRVIARHQRIAPDTSWPLHRVLAALEDHGYRPVRKGLRWHSRCPAHQRSNPDALEIHERSNGKVNIRCFRDCDYRQILGILGLAPPDLYPQVMA